MGELWPTMAYSNLLPPTNYGQLWPTTTNYDQLWPTMPTMVDYGGVLWPTMANWGQPWPTDQLVLPQLWPTTTNCGQLWPTMADYNQLWPTTTNCGQLWPTMADYNQLWPTTANYGLLQPAIPSLLRVVCPISPIASPPSLSRALCPTPHPPHHVCRGPSAPPVDTDHARIPHTPSYSCCRRDQSPHLWPRKRATRMGGYCSRGRLGRGTSLTRRRSAA